MFFWGKESTWVPRREQSSWTDAQLCPEGNVEFTNI